MSEVSRNEGNKAHDIVLDTPPDDGVPPKDPTINVQNLLRAAVIRVDDLRDAETRRVNQKIESERIRINQQHDAEQRRVDEKMSLIEKYERLLQQAEAKRIDAIRVVDVNAVSVANERAAAQATVLANQVSASADTLRALVATTASTVAQQLAQVTGQLSDRLAVVERSNYEGKGRESYADPVLAQLIIEVKGLREAQSTGAGKGAGLQSGWLIALGALGGIGTIAGIIAIIAELMK
jgi:hypothetical protein